jgi:hypothetical protein
MTEEGREIIKNLIDKVGMSSPMERPLCLLTKEPNDSIKELFKRQHINYKVIPKTFIPEETDDNTIFLLRVPKIIEMEKENELD